MRRAVLTLGGTAAGLAALFSFKTHSLAGTAALSAPSTPGTSAAAAPAADGSGSMTPRSSGSHGTGKSTGNGKTAGKKSGMGMTAAPRTLTGAVENTQHGPMQVQITLTGTRITKVTVLQRTDDGAESAQIDSTAIPKLTAETLAAQSARIDAVSGATYTSSGYIQSLQSALDKGGA
jgi:uncharacterized protein with FMN-binding domain